MFELCPSLEGKLVCLMELFSKVACWKILANLRTNIRLGGLMLVFSKIVGRNNLLLRINLYKIICSHQRTCL